MKMDENELIERLENLARHAIHTVGEPCFVLSLDDGIALHLAIDRIKNDSAAQKTGKWEHRNVSSEGVEEWQAAQCSVCGKWNTTPYLYYFYHYDFCPCCGARMERE